MASFSEIGSSRIIRWNSCFTLNAPTETKWMLYVWERMPSTTIVQRTLSFLTNGFTSRTICKHPARKFVHCSLVVGNDCSVTLFFILHFSLVIPFRWLAGNTHKLAKDKWGARSMGCAIDILHTACGEILDDIKLIHDEKYMMNIFDEIAEEIPDFKMFLSFNSRTKDGVRRKIKNEVCSV